MQGLGKVGWDLACRLRKAGAIVIGCDVDPAHAEVARDRLQIATVDPEDIYGVAADIFAPCALGGAISELTLPRLRVEIIAGSANNQILSATIAEEVFRRGILYAPDYVINAGGLVNVYVEMNGYDQTRALRLTQQIYGRLRNVFALSRELNVPTSVAADRIAEERLGALRTSGAVTKAA